jgi:hypothetical protein
MKRFQVRDITNKDNHWGEVEFDIIFFDDDNRKERYSDNVYYDYNEALTDRNLFEARAERPTHWDVFRNY